VQGGRCVVAPVTSILQEESAPPSSKLEYKEDIYQDEDQDWDLGLDRSHHCYG
jgi:hypothetical protein